jgi:hypothetical protein
MSALVGIRSGTERQTENAARRRSCVLEVGEELQGNIMRRSLGGGQADAEFGFLLLDVSTVRHAGV